MSSLVARSSLLERQKKRATRDERRTYRGFVVGLRFAADFFAPVFDAAARFFFAADFFAAGFAAGFAVDPAVTRVECFARGFTGFFGAASADALKANVATNATSRNVIVFRSMGAILQQIGEREADLRDEHHAVHVRPRDVVFFHREIFRPPQHQIKNV
jgi:hypothetical protein